MLREETAVTMCIACTSEAVARVLDGAFRKPVCADHRRLYGEKGYLIDALRPLNATPPEPEPATEGEGSGAA